MVVSISKTAFCRFERVQVILDVGIQVPKTNLSVQIGEEGFGKHRPQLRKRENTQLDYIKKKNRKRIRQ